MSQILEKKFQISLTFSIRVTEDAIQPKTLLEEESADLPQQNRRLLLALIERGGTELEQVLEYMLAQQLGQYGVEDWEKLLLGHVPLPEEMLLPVIKTLDAPDATALQADIKDGTFFRRIKAFRECFQTHLEQVATSELP